MSEKPWYEKLGIGVTIVAGICTIFAFIYNLNTSSSNADMEINADNNEINMENQSAIVIGDNNTINYNDANSDGVQNSELDDSFMFKEDALSVISSYGVNPIQSSNEGIDILITAKTSFPANRVTITATSDEGEETFFGMHGGKYEWYFNANFYIKGTYIIVITAYSSVEESVSDTFTYTY